MTGPFVALTLHGQVPEKAEVQVNLANVALVRKDKNGRAMRFIRPVRLSIANLSRESIIIVTETPEDSVAKANAQ